MLKDPSVYDTKKLVAKLAATIEKLVSGTKLGYGFDIMTDFVEGYEDLARLKLRETFFVYCPNVVDMESDEKGWVYNCSW